MKAITALALVMLISAPAAAQPDPTRRILLPSIRAATDCIAGAVKNHTGAGAAFRNDDWTGVLMDARRSCVRQIATMVQLHETYKGEGSGNAFLNGPYMADLPRAIKARIGDELVRLAESDRASEALKAARLAEAEARKLDAENKARAARQERIKETTGARDLLRIRLFDCLNEQIAQLAPSEEAASVIASAALTLCKSHFEPFFDAAIAAEEVEKTMRHTAASLEESRVLLDQVLRERVLAMAVRHKADRRSGVNTPADSAAGFFSGKQKPAPQLKSLFGFDGE